jgi:hypothetical protein
VNLLVEFVSKD